MLVGFGLLCSKRVAVELTVMVVVGWRTLLLGPCMWVAAREGVVPTSQGTRRSPFTDVWGKGGVVPVVVICV
jgi:hypothetical protein